MNEVSADIGANLQPIKLDGEAPIEISDETVEEVAALKLLSRVQNLERQLVTERRERKEEIKHVFWAARYF